MQPMIAWMRLTLGSMIFIAAVFGDPWSMAAVQASQSSRYSFVGPQGTLVVDLGVGRLELDNKAMPLRDCSDTEFYCYRADDAGFGIIFPKHCSANLPPWKVQGLVTQLVSVVPHSTDFVATTEGLPRFLFDYGWSRGLTGIWYDLTGEHFRSPQEWSNIPYVRRVQFLYKAANGELALACQE